MLEVIRDSETWEVVVVLSMPEETRPKAKVELSLESFFRVSNMFLIFDTTFSLSSIASLLITLLTFNNCGIHRQVGGLHSKPFKSP